MVFLVFLILLTTFLIQGSAKNHKNPQKDPVLNKIKEQVKVGDYSHPDLVVIPESELIRMKVFKFLFFLKMEI